MSASDFWERDRTVRRWGASPLAVITAVGLSAALLTGSGAPQSLPGLERVASGCPAPGGARIPDAAMPTTGDFAFLGHGWGHGMGMSQYGAQGAARLGCSYKTILTTYYRGSHVAPKAMSSTVVLSLLKGSSRSTLEAKTGTVTWVTGRARVAQPAGTTWQVKRVAKDAKGAAGVVLVDQLGKQRMRVAAGGRLDANHSGHVVRVRSFTGSRTSASSDLTTRYDQFRITVGATSNEVTEIIVPSGGVSGVEKYLWALAEIPASWPREALRAQAVAARSYLATKFDKKLNAFRVSVTTSDQVYGGYKRESSDEGMGRPWRNAVDATRGQVVLTASGQIVTTMYSSSMGGFTEDRGYVYGSGGISYLKAVDDSRWDLASDNPYRSWAVGVSAATLASKLKLSTVTGVSVAARGRSERLGGVVVTGTRSGKKVTLKISGSSLRSKLGLRSPGFVVKPVPRTTPSPSPSGTPSALRVGGQPLVGDFDGDGRDDVGWYRNGVVGLRTDRGKVLRYRITNAPSGTALVGDFNGDGRDGIAVYHRGRWAVREALSSGPGRVVGYGRAGDTPVVGHWWGKGRADGIGVVRGDRWFLRASASGGPSQRVFRWGPAAPALVGDWWGTGTTEPAQRRGTTWRLAQMRTGKAASSAPRVVLSRKAGTTRDKGLAGSWRGDKRDSIVLVNGCTFAFRSPSLTKVAGRISYCG